MLEFKNVIELFELFSELESLVRFVHVEMIIRVEVDLVTGSFDSCFLFRSLFIPHE